MLAGRLHETRDGNGFSCVLMAAICLVLVGSRSLLPGSHRLPQYMPFLFASKALRSKGGVVTGMQAWLEADHNNRFWWHTVCSMLFRGHLRVPTSITCSLHYSIAWLRAAGASPHDPRPALACIPLLLCSLAPLSCSALFTTPSLHRSDRVAI